MARVNFGRSPTVRGYNPLENALKPGYVIKMRGQFYMVDAVEGMTTDLVVTANGNTAGTEVGDGFDSGWFEDEDLEPFSNHIYMVIPSLYRQPKFIDRDGSYDGTGFPNDETEVTLTSGTHSIGGASRTKVGDISGKCFLRHPAGVTRWSLDESPENDKTGWIDVNISPADDPNPNFTVVIESSENQLPNWRFLNDTGETLYYPVIHLCGIKARLRKMTPAQVKEVRDMNNGRFFYKVVVPQGLPYTSSIGADYSPEMS